MKIISDSEAKNPCIKECKYDDDNVCIACLRTKKRFFIGEIAAIKKNT